MTTMDLADAHRVIHDLYIRIGKNIRVARHTQGINQGDLAAAAGMSRPSLANIEAARQRPQMHVFLALAQALGLSLGELLGNGALPTLANRLPDGGEAAVSDARRLIEELQVSLGKLAALLGADS